MEVSATPARPMDVPGQPAARGLDDLFIFLLSVPANLLLMRYVGEWLVWAGLAGLGLGLGVMATAIGGRSAARRFLSNLLLCLTVMSFNGWAFSHVANLPFYLGLFFYMLFGLILGATIFRMLAGSAAVRPWGRALAGALVAIPWVGGLMLEAQYFPDDAYRVCIEKMRIRRPSDERAGNPLKTEIPRQVRSYLQEHHSADLVIGYWQWALQNGKVDITLPDTGRTLTYELRQRRWGLVIRLAASMLLLGYGVFSQIAKLKPSGVRDDQNRAPIRASR